MDKIVNNIIEQALPDIDALRVFHGRGNCYPGLEFITVDWFCPLLLVSFYKPPTDIWLEEFRQKLQVVLLSPHIKTIVFQYRYQLGSPSEVVKGSLEDDFFALERGLRYPLKIAKNQNVGFFLDMKNCREWLHDDVKGKSVLNLFSYTCAFSVVAAAAGAKTVVNIDMSKGALATGKLSHELNGVNTDSVFFFGHDIFKSWGKLRKYGPYDRVVVDPPSFQKGSFDAKKDYVKLVKKLPELLTPNGKVLACLNSPALDFDFLRKMFLEIGGLIEECVIPTPASFPEEDENKGLKTLVFRRDV